MQFKIPQDVDIEDKIVGPLTMKQLIILGVGGAITYAIYTVVARRYFIEIWLPAILPTSILTLCFAFLKINGIPFTKWILLTLEFFKNPHKRNFQMGAADHYKATIFKKEEAKKTTDKDKSAIDDKMNKRGKILEMSKVVDDYTPKAKK